MPTDDEVIIEAIRAVLQAHPAVEGQGRFAHLVNEQLQLRQEDPVTEARVRRLALSHGLARVQAEYRRGHGGLPEACPWCGAEVTLARNRTLDGGEVLVGGRCATCGYTQGREKRDARLFVFQRTMEVVRRAWEETRVDGDGLHEPIGVGGDGAEAASERS